MNPGIIISKFTLSNLMRNLRRREWEKKEKSYELVYALREGSRTVGGLAASLVCALANNSLFFLFFLFMVCLITIGNTLMFLSSRSRVRRNACYS